MIYEPPDLAVGRSAKAEVQCEVKDSRANDTPARVRFAIEAKREGDCEYSRK